MERPLLEILVQLANELLMVAHRHPLGFANFTLVRLLQFWNASLPMLVTLSGTVMLVRLLQF